MPRWLWWAPVGVLVLCGTLVSFRLGWIDANLTETEAIQAYANRYVTEAGPGAKRSDCWARPGETVWLVVRCGQPGAYWEYRVNRFGGLQKLSKPGETGAPEPQKEPQT